MSDVDGVEQVELDDVEFDAGCVGIRSKAADLGPRLGSGNHIVALTGKLERCSLPESTAGTGDQDLLGHGHSLGNYLDAYDREPATPGQTGQ
ncbi:hypothetical protein GCM10009625_33180 [Brachybacterium fresconis]